MPGRSRPHSKHLSRKLAGFAHALPAGLTLLALNVGQGHAQTLTSDMLRQQRDGFSGQYRPLQPNRPSQEPDTTGSTSQAGATAPSRIGAIPTYQAPAASGASNTGYDSLGRKRKIARKRAGFSPTVGPPTPGPAPAQITPVIVPIAPAAPPLPTAATANRPRLAPAMMGSVTGQPFRRRLKADDDPFGAVGFYRGAFLVKPAIEFLTGYDTNPGRIQNGKGSWLYTVAPELLAASDWERHSLTADLRGSFTGYGTRNEVGCDCQPGSVASPLPVGMDRPDFTGRVNGRLDISRDTRILSEARLRVSTDNPGSPNIQTNLLRYPIYTSVGGSLGAAQSFNRFELSATGTLDRTVYQQSTFSDNSTLTNADRNFNQIGGVLRGSYEILPTVKPFGEVAVDRRERDTQLDRFGYARNSRGETFRVGSTFELGRLVTGEASIGYTTRSYEDARLTGISGLLTSASLAWKPTGLTTVRLATVSSIDESTLPGVSGVLTRTYTAEVEHAFRRYLVATFRTGLTTSDFEGSERSDKIYTVGGDLVYKFTRDVQAKAQIRHDWLNSTLTNANYEATLFMVGMRLQR